MSEAPPDTREAVEFPHQGDVAFSALLDALAPEAEGAAAAPDGGSAQQADAGAAGAPAVVPAAGAAGGAAAPAGGDGAPAAAGGDGAPGTGAPEAGLPAAEADGSPGEPAAGGAAEPAADTAGADLPATWTADAAAVLPELGKLSTTIEENLVKAYQTEAYNAARTEFAKYFEALEKHPRLLVGTEVPAVGKEGMERLKDSNDAKEWQEAIKELLVQEIKDRAQVRMDESKQILETVHASIDLFKNNKDLIPGTKGFNKELADRFAAFAEPYEVRADGKLQGYSIPVQPLIDRIREQMKAAVPPAKATSAAAPAAPPADPPQAGLTSKAGTSGDKEDFSTLFGTIGLPHLKI